MNIKEFLNQFLSNLHILNTKFYHYHWFVKGENFFTLHEQFENLYTEGHQNIDEIAERILMIGGTPYSTLKEYLTHATLVEAEGDLTSREMVAATVSDLEQLAGELKEGIEIASEENDPVTEDMLIGILSSYEKTIWLLKSYLG